METKLRPIGTEFTVEYPPAMNSTETRWSRHVNRVVRHVDAVVDRVGNTKRMEEVECLSYEPFDRPYHLELEAGSWVPIAD